MFLIEGRYSLGSLPDGCIWSYMEMINRSAVFKKISNNHPSYPGRVRCAHVKLNDYLHVIQTDMHASPDAQVYLVDAPEELKYKTEIPVQNRFEHLEIQDEDY